MDYYTMIQWSTCIKISVLSFLLIYIIFWVSISSIDISFIHIIQQCSFYSSPIVLWIVFVYGLINMIHIVFIFLVLDKVKSLMLYIRMLWISIHFIFLVLLCNYYFQIDSTCQYDIVNVTYILSISLAVSNTIIFLGDIIHIKFFKKNTIEYNLLNQVQCNITTTINNSNE